MFLLLTKKEEFIMAYVTDHDAKLAVARWKQNRSQQNVPTFSMKEKINAIRPHIFLKDFGRNFCHVPIPKKDVTIEIYCDHIKAVYPTLTLIVTDTTVKLQTSDKIRTYCPRGEFPNYLKYFCQDN
jgi:hypothetical protein